MKKILLGLFCLGLVPDTMAFSVMRKPKVYHVEITNESDYDRKDEPVVITSKEINRIKWIDVNVRVTDNGAPVQYQLDDMDGDLQNDELFFVTDVKAHSRKVIDVEFCGEQDTTKWTDRIYTALQFRDKKDKFPDLLRVEAKGSTNLFNDIYMHGVTIESELVGYRIYFDERQNIDLYGKKYRRIELPETQFYTTAEQLKAGYGVDVLWAGKAMGCGSLKRNGADKVANWTDVGIRGQRVVTTGPLRTVIEVYDIGREMFGHSGSFFEETTRQYYTLVAGHRDLQVDVNTDRGYHTYCTGVQKVGVTAEDSVRRGHKSEGWIRDGIAASWGCDYPDMGKKHIWAPEAIGMAVYVPQMYVEKSFEDELNYVYVLRPKKEKIRYYVSFCADKEERGYHNAHDWFASLDEWKQKIEHPVKIRVKK